MQSWGWPDPNTSATVTADPLREGNSLKILPSNWGSVVYFPVTLPEKYTVADIAQIQFETYFAATVSAPVELFIAPASAIVGYGATFSSYPVYLSSTSIQISNEGQWYPISIAREQITDPNFNTMGNTPDFSAVDNLSQFILGIGTDATINEASCEYYLDNITIVLNGSGSATVCNSLGSGDFGENNALHWALCEDGTLTINGEGAIPDYGNSGDIPWYAVHDSIRSAVIRDKVTTIGQMAFVLCTNLTSVTISNSVASIEKAAFAVCSSLTSVTIPNSIISIGVDAFSACNTLTSVTIPNSVTTIGEKAFNCTALTDVTVSWATPLSVPANLFITTNTLHVPAGTKALYRADPVWGNFEIIDDGNGSPDCKWQLTPTMAATLDSNGVLTISTTQEEGEAMPPDYVYDGSGNKVPWNTVRDNIKSVVIEDKVTTIGNLAFYNCTGLTSATIPESVTTIGYNAFYNCSGLTSATIPESVTTIGNFAFYNCTGLTSLTIPENVTTIGYSAFSNCTGLSGSLTIPASVISIGGTAFASTGLSEINVNGSNINYCSDNGILYNKTQTTLIQYPPKKTGTVTIPESVTTIESSAFSYCSGLTSVTIPESVTTIGLLAFSNCYGLTSLSIPNSVTTIAQVAFEWCTGLTDVTVDWAMPLSIPANVFSAVNTSLATLHIPAGTKAIYQADPVWGTFGTILEPGEAAYEFNFDADTIGKTYSTTHAYGWPNANTTATVAADPQREGNSLKMHADNYDGVVYFPVTLPEGYTVADIVGIKFETYFETTDSTSVELFIAPVSATIGSGVLFTDYPVYLKSSDGGTPGLAAPIQVSDAGQWYPLSITREQILDPDFNCEGNTPDFSAVDSLSRFLFGVGINVAPGSEYYLDNISIVLKEKSGCGQTWNLTPTMTATLDCEGVLTVSTTQNAEGMPGYSYASSSGDEVPWATVRDSIRSLVIEDKVTGIGGYAFSYCSNLTSATIPNSITIIGEQAFAQSGITSVTIPENVEYIGADAFWACPSLDTVYFNATNCQTMVNYDNVHYTWQPAFWSDDALHTLVIGNNVKNIPDFAFCGSGLQTVSIPGNVEHIGFSAFSYCGQLTAIDVATANPYYTGIDGVLFDKSKTTLMQCPGGKTGEYVIPNATDSIADYAFYGCSALTNIVIPNNVKSIGLLAFEYAGISELTIPESITYIGRYAFYACPSLETVNFNAINCTVMGYDGGNSVYPAFQKCTSLHTLNIGTEVQNIPIGAFWQCGFTGDLIIPNSVVSIEDNAFDECSGLTSLTITGSVTTIGEQAFAGCSNLASVSVDWATPLSVPDNVFEDVDTSKAILYIPSGTQSLYEIADVWKDFGTIMERASINVTADAPAGSNGEGSINLVLEIPTNTLFTGSFYIQLPEGFTVNMEKTSLSESLSSLLDWTITQEDGGKWLVTISLKSDKSSFRKMTDVAYTKIMEIVYNVEETVENGSYQSTISNLNFEFEDGTVVKEIEIPVDVSVDHSYNNEEGIKAIQSGMNVYISDNQLYVDTPQAEMIYLYSVIGQLEYSCMKAEGMKIIPLKQNNHRILIVKGSSGWVKKMMK